ncbi:MAG: prolyl oligopeptidase family serine peptidase, partial [Anaerolineales bacterium]|nr:prolyl oligopeptidase family serine peptidase [Anaerolineales bacterium]
MRTLLIALIALLLLVACATPEPPATPAPPTPEPTLAPASKKIIEFESLTFRGHLWSPFMPPPEEGEATRVTGMLSIPESRGRIPAVILTHGCGSIGSAELSWADRLNEFGVATLLVHSFGARHIPEVCTGQYQVNIASMLADAYSALDTLAAHSRIDPSKIAILGLSFGGRTALWASHTRFQERYGSGENQFAAYLAFYPASCYIQLADETEVSGGPMRIFHGAADDWIPIEPCQAYIERLKTAGIDAALLEYPDSHHGFDDPQTPNITLPNVLSPETCTFVEQDGQIIDTDTGEEAGI